MARTRLFSRLCRIAASARAAHVQGLSGAEFERCWQLGHVDRRQFVAGAGQALGGVLLGLAASCDGPALLAQPLIPGQARVAVVGGGMAGLHCAYRLREAGVSAVVYEASSRVGGRMFTDREHFGEQVAELGGELIDSNHITLRALAEEFGIALDDRDADLDPETTRETWWISNVAVPESTIVQQFSQVAPLMAALVEQADSDEAAFAELDGISLADWLGEHVPMRDYPELHAVLTAAYRGEYGLETVEQSVLNLLYLIGADDPDPFRIFGESDERYHAHSGSQTFCDRLSEALANQIERGMKLVSAKRSGEAAYSLTFEHDNDTLEVEVDHVVFALPFTALRQVDLAALGLPQSKLTMIEQLGYGSNAKVMAGFSERVWREQHNASGSVTSDGALQQCWDTALGQPGGQGILTNFLGGEQGVECGRGSAEEWALEVLLAGVEPIFPGTTAAYVAGSALRMHWPSHPHTLGSYACYRPGQWSFWSYEGERFENVHFCGEHTSLDFQGYMEGAAETGSRAAGEILGDLGIAPSRTHQGLLALWAELPARRAHEHCPALRERRRLLNRRIREVLAAGLSPRSV